MDQNNFLLQLIKDLIANEEVLPPNENKIVAMTVRDRLQKLVAQEGNFNSSISELGPSNNPNRPIRDMEGGIDIVKGITGLFPNREFHIRDQGDDGVTRKASFCGPGTQLQKRLENFNPQTGEYDSVITPPINNLDKGCMEHDIAYSKHSDLKGRHDADRELIKYADKVLKDPKSTTTQRRNANIVKAIMKGKLLLGVGNLIDDQNYLEDKLNKIIRNDNYANIRSSQTNAGKGSMQMNRRQWQDKLDQIIREEMRASGLLGGCDNDSSCDCDY